MQIKERTTKNKVHLKVQIKAQFKEQSKTKVHSDSGKPNTPGAEDQGWELGEAGSDECIEDCGPRRLHLSYSTRFGGSRRSNL